MESPLRRRPRRIDSVRDAALAAVRSKRRAHRQEPALRVGAAVERPLSATSSMTAVSGGFNRSRSRLRSFNKRR